METGIRDMEVINSWNAQLYFRFNGWMVSDFLPGAALLPIFHPFRKPQRIVLGVLVLLTIMDLFWLLQGCAPQGNAPLWCYVPTFLHLFLSLLTIFCGIPLWLAVREERRRDKEESYK